ncbi:MAG: hypothetical protein MNPFHGCM_01691 [Gemmatimonadaceae bacterium]|nr:hypothetical protein [Gemmatimonadaceae bacterium]
MRANVGSMRTLLGLLALVAVVAGAGRVPPADTLVLLVRHAEKSSPSGDVPLSVVGEERARALVAVAREAGVVAAITTQFQRTQQTAAPTLQALGLSAEVVAASNDIAEHARQIGTMIRERYRGRTVLVVGHSNTVPAIIAALGGPSLPDICDSEYDRLFFLNVSDGSPTRLIQSRYGAPSPTDSACASMRR